MGRTVIVTRRDGETIHNFFWSQLLGNDYKGNSAKYIITQIQTTLSNSLKIPSANTGRIAHDVVLDFDADEILVSINDLIALKWLIFLG